jgi:hypothetical protein
MARFDAFASDHESLFNYSKFSPSNGSLASLTLSDSTCVQKFRERASRLFDIENEKNQLINVSYQVNRARPVLMLRRCRTCFFDLRVPRSSWNKSVWTTSVRHVIIVSNSCEKTSYKTSCEKCSL